MDEAVLERKYSRVDGRRRSSTIEPDAPSQDSKVAMMVEDEERRKVLNPPLNGNGNKVRFSDNSIEVSLLRF